MGIEPNSKTYVFDSYNYVVIFKYFIIIVYKLLIYCNFCRIFSLVVGLLHHF